MSRDPRSTAARPGFDRQRLVVALVLLAAPWVAFPPDFIPRALLDGGDDLLANLPELLYSGKKLLEGELLWTPALWMGHPLWGEPEFATFYLPKLMLLVGQPVVSYAAYLVLHYLAAEAGAYLYLKSLGIGRHGAVFGALAYAYAGFMLGHRAHTMYVSAGAWAPFVLLLFDRATERGDRVSYLAAALAFAMLPLSGAIQLTAYLAWVILLLAAARSFFERRRRPLFGAGIALVPSLLVSALQIVPSYDLSRQLAMDMRGDYALDVMHSFHPLLLPTLAFPLPPLDGERYSRAGVVVLCAVAVALFRIRSAPPRIRAWAVVGGVASLVMLGGYLPPLARLLHGLPGVGVLRGPVRHNFEFALALSVLGAYGVESARRAGAGALVRWLLAGAAFGALSYAAVRLSAAGYVTDPDAASLLSGVTPGAVLGGALAFALWVLSLAGRNAPRAPILWALVAVVPILETAWAMRVEAPRNRSALGQIEEARAALPAPGGFVRLLSVSLLRGSADDLAGNSVLFHPGVESLQGYSSIAYGTARKVLDLDMHGQPTNYDELAFSILPSVFGVTHVVLPSAACGSVRSSLAQKGELCARTTALAAEALRKPPMPATVAGGQLDCASLATDTTFHYRLEATARAASTDALGAWFVFVGAPRWERRFGFDIPGPRLGPSILHTREPVSLIGAESWGGLMLKNRRAAPIEFSDMGLYVERDVTRAAMGPLEPETSLAQNAEASASSIRLAPGGGVARIERRVRWPLDARSRGGSAVLEVEARATSGSPGDLVVDLHADASYDPDDAELVVRGPELGPAWRVLSKEIRIGSAPEEFFLRAVATGSGAIEVREARLAERFDERVYGYPVETDRYPENAHIEDSHITLGPLARIDALMHLPVRAFDVVLDAEAPAPLEGPVYFGLHTESLFDLPRGWQVDKGVFDARVRLHHVALLPPDVRDSTLFVRVDGTKPLRVNELSATDACALRAYRNPRRLANGLFLYENPRALPRAYTVGRTVFARDAADVRRTLLDLDPSDLGKVAVVSDEVPKDLGPGAVEHADFGQRSADVVVRSDDRPTLLVVNERFDPDFLATVDGAPAAVLPVNGLVRGVVVPQGRHHVRFEYRAPRAIWFGVGLALLGVLMALFIAPVLGRLGTGGSDNPSQNSV